MISKGAVCEEIKLNSQAVNGLIKINKEKPGENFDLRFLKGILIGFCTVKTVKGFKSNDDIDEAVLELIKGHSLS